MATKDTYTLSNTKYFVILSIRNINSVVIYRYSVLNAILSTVFCVCTTDSKGRKGLFWRPIVTVLRNRGNTET